MDDRRLDELLGEAVGSAPPEDVVRAVSPWRHAMDQVLWGFALTSISLDFLLLNYILPSIGAALMLLGFRTLRANRTSASPITPRCSAARCSSPRSSSAAR